MLRRFGSSRKIAIGRTPSCESHGIAPRVREGHVRQKIPKVAGRIVGQAALRPPSYRRTVCAAVHAEQVGLPRRTGRNSSRKIRSTRGKAMSAHSSMARDPVSVGWNTPRSAVDSVTGGDANWRFLEMRPVTQTGARTKLIRRAQVRGGTTTTTQLFVEFGYVHLTREPSTNAPACYPTSASSPARPGRLQLYFNRPPRPPREHRRRCCSIGPSHAPPALPDVYELLRAMFRSGLRGVEILLATALAWKRQFGNTANFPRPDVRLFTWICWARVWSRGESRERSLSRKSACKFHQERKRTKWWSNSITRLEAQFAERKRKPNSGGPAIT